MNSAEMPQFQGCFSYKNNNDCSMPLDDKGLFFVMETMDINIAKIRFETRTDGQPPQPVPIPANISIILANTVPLQPAARVAEEFFILTWIGNYVILRDEKRTSQA